VFFVLIIKGFVEYGVKKKGNDYRIYTNDKKAECLIY